MMIHFFLMKILLMLQIFCGEMSIFGVELNNINLDDVNFCEDYLETIIHVRFMAGCNRFKQRKAFKKEVNKKLMPIAWHPTRCWCFCMTKDQKKQIEKFCP